MFKLFKEDSDSVLLTRRNAAIDVFRGLVMLLMVLSMTSGLYMQFRIGWSISGLLKTVWDFQI